MDDIKWGPKRECTGDQPCSDWVLVRINRQEGPYWSNPLPAKNVDWNRAVEYRLPAEYEALIAAKDPTHEQMRATLAAHYEGMPDALVEIDRVKAAYHASGKLVDCEWKYLKHEWQDAFRVMFRAGQEHSQKHSS